MALVERESVTLGRAVMGVLVEQEPDTVQARGTAEDLEEIILATPILLRVGQAQERERGREEVSARVDLFLP